jgi:hypothetical protein
VEISFYSLFGLVPDVFAYDNVACSGIELRLEDCPHVNSDDCSQYEGAGVVCNTTYNPGRG